MKQVVRSVISAGSLTGDPVHNSKGEELGSIKSIMLDTDRGRIAYAVLSFGGFLGFGDQLFAIPWSALRIDHANKAVVFDVDQAQLEQAKGFDKDDWPDFANDDWNEQNYRFWKQDPYWS